MMMMLLLLLFVLVLMLIMVGIRNIGCVLSNVIHNGKFGRSLECFYNTQNAAGYACYELGTQVQCGHGIVGISSISVPLINWPSGGANGIILRDLPLGIAGGRRRRRRRRRHSLLSIVRHRHHRSRGTPIAALIPRE